MGRRIFLVGALFALLLFGPSGAGAAATFTDPQGDAVGGAPDITQVVVSNDFDGNITFALTIPNRSSFTSDDFVVILLNVDRNASTGNNGVDYAIVVDATRADLLQWNGTTFVRVLAPTLTASNNNMTLTINRSDLAKTTAFSFGVAYFLTDHLKEILTNVHRVERWIAVIALAAGVAALVVIVRRKSREVIGPLAKPSR